MRCVFINGWFSGGTLFALALLAGPDLQADLEYRTGFERVEDFDNSSNGERTEWFLLGDLRASVERPAAQGEKSLLLNGDGWLLFSPSEDLLREEVVWVDYLIQPSVIGFESLPQEVPIGPQVFTEFVAVGPNGEAFVLAGNKNGPAEWISSNNLVQDIAEAKTWLRMTFRLNYQQRYFDVWIEEVLVVADVPFLDFESREFDGFAIRSREGDAVRIDRFYAGTKNPLFADVNRDGIPDGLAVTGRYDDSNRNGVPDIEDMLSNHPDFSLDGIDFLSPNAIIDDDYQTRSKSHYQAVEDLDQDGIADSWEHRILRHPKNKFLQSLEDVRPEDDFDNDGLSNVKEIVLGTDPASYDTDRDMIGDGYEAKWPCLDPLVPAPQEAPKGWLGDFDADGLYTHKEVMFGTNPCHSDTDGDGFSDFEELKVGSYPTVPTDYPLKE